MPKIFLGYDRNQRQRFANIIDNGPYKSLAVQNNLFNQGLSPRLTKRTETVGSVLYLGWAQPGSATSSAEWRLGKLDFSGAVFVLAWADGNIDFDNVWDDRASLTYS